MALNINGGALEFDAVINIEQFQAQLTRMEQSLKGLTNTANEQSREIESFAKNAAAAVASYASLTVGTELISDIVRVRGEFQKIEAVLTNSLGSNSEAQKSLQMISDFASTTPFSLQELSSSYVKLVNQGIKPTKEELRQLGDLAASTGKGFDQLTEAIIDAQTGEFERLKEFGIRASKEGDNVKFSFKGVETQVKFTADAIKNYITGLGNLQGVSGSTAAISRTLEGQISNLKDAWSRALNEIGKSGEGVFSETIEVANDLVNNYQKVLDILSFLVIAYGSYRAAMIATNVIERVSLSIRQQAAVQTALALKQNIALTASQKLGAVAAITWQRAQMGLNAALLSNAPGLAIAGVAALVAALTVLRDKSFEVKTAQEALAEAQEDAAGKFTEQEAEIKQYVEVLNNQNVAESTRLEAYNKLKEIAPSIISGLTFQAAKTTDLTNATNAYLVSLRQQILLESKRAQYAEALKKKEENFNAAKPFLGKDGKVNDGGVLDVLNPFSQSTIKDSEGELRIKAFQDAAQAVTDIEKDLQKQLGATSQDGIKFRISQLQDEQNFLDKRSDAYRKNEQEIASLQKLLIDIAAKTERTLKDLLAQESIKADVDLGIQLSTSKADLDSIKKKLESELNSINPNTAGFTQIRDSYGALIDQVQKRIDAYSTKKVQAENNKAAKSFEDLQNKIKALNDQRADVLKAIDDLNRGAKQTGLTKELSELDKINQKYDEQILKINEFNKKVDEFNRKNKTSVAKVGLTDVNRLNDARNLEIKNFNIKEDAERFKKSLEQQKQIFEQVEEAKKQIGVKKALEMFSEQRKGFDSFADFLRNEALKLSPQFELGIQNAGEVAKMEAITKALADIDKKRAEEQVKRYAELFNITLNFKDKESLVNEQFNQRKTALDEAYAKGLVSNYTEAYYAIEKLRNDDLKALQADLVKQSEVFKTLGADLFLLDDKALKENVAKLKKALKDGFVEVDKGGGIQEKIALTPEMIQSLQAGVDKIEGLSRAVKKLENLKKLIGDSAEELKEMADHAQKAAAIFNTMAEAFAPLNAELSEGASQLADLANTTSSVLASLASGDLVGAITTIVGSMVKSLVDAKKSADEAKKAVADFYQQIYLGEINAAIASRERAVAEAASHELTLERLAAQKKALEENKKANQEQAAALLQQLQQEQYITEQKTKKGVGNPLFGVASLFGLGGKTKVEEELRSLAGMTFDQIEKLFNSGQLTDKAKELFEQLQKLKQEGVDIDKQLQEIAEQTKQVFTGTTADGLTDSITEMFKAGKTSAADFAAFFEERMGDAALSIFKNKAIAESMQKFYEEFAAAAQSGNELTESEINSLRQGFTSDMEALQKQFEQMQKITGLDFKNQASGASSGSSLQGAIKGITEQQAELLAGQFGGLRMTAIEQLNVAKQGLDYQMRIESNTAATVSRLDALLQKFDRYETGAAKLSMK